MFRYFLCFKEGFMNKKMLSIFLVLVVFGIVAVAAYDFCFVVDDVSVSYSGAIVILENASDSNRTVRYTVTFNDGSTTGTEQKVVKGNSTERIRYGKSIKSVDMCW
jgi:hypothetical protein